MSKEKYEYIQAVITNSTHKDIQSIMNRLEGLLPVEFLDVEYVFLAVRKAGKYNDHDWEKGVKFDSMKNYDSMFHHLCEARQGEVEDKETKLHPLLHLACRALMEYTLHVRERNEAADKYLEETLEIRTIKDAPRIGNLTREQIEEAVRNRLEDNPDDFFGG